ncbi:MAG: DEAD/DEAH box helicase family protein [Verrucomicrobia bacterium]|nr:DEAD/DEAH box helicase family protein [Verrucomicrobiota bacterium]
MTNFIFDKFYIPEETADLSSIESKFTKLVFKDQLCEKCEYREDRDAYLYLCMECDGYVATYSFYSRVNIKGKSYIGLPRAESIGKQYVDKRTGNYDLNEKLAIVSDLWENQLQVIKNVLGKCTKNDRNVYVPEDMNKTYNGIIEAPPRTGKTFIVLNLALSLGHKTLILAHQKELLNQFMKDIQKRTNFDEVENSYGFCKKEQDFYQYDICFATYQTFISLEGKKKLQNVKRLFGSIFIDEVHRSSAFEYSKVIAAFPAKNRVGVTGTIERKDNLHFVASTIVGKVLTSVSAKVMVPTVVIHSTKIGPNSEYKSWTYAMRFLERSDKRTALIVKYVLHDLKNGRHLVIPVTFVTMCKNLAHEINIAYGSEIAVAFHGKSKRDDILNKATTGEYRVVVGIRSIVSLGINVPIWDTLYEIAPISNPPNMKQETLRICTVAENKNDPLIRHFVDDMVQSKACFRTCYVHTYLKEKFRMSEETRKRAKLIMSSLKRPQLTHSEKSLFSR